MLRSIVVLSITLSLVGCASTKYEFSELARETNYDFSLIDERDKVSIEGGKKSLFEALYYHGDNRFLPTKVEMFKTTLNNSFPIPPKKVVLHNFDVVDSFSIRDGQATAAGLASLSYSAALLADADIPKGSDYIRCVIRASVDNRLIESISIIPYTPYQACINVNNEPGYTKSVHDSIETALKKWMASAKKKE